MSAPEVRVTTYYDAACDGCHQVRSHSVESDVREWAESHEAECVPLRLARLQARWDARTEAERALIENWESQARVLSARYDDTGERELRGRSKALRIAADELERAIGGGE